MDDNEVRAVKWVSLAVVISVMIGVGGCHLTNRVAIQSGLCRGALPGMQGAAWVKCQ